MAKAVEASVFVVAAVIAVDDAVHGVAVDFFALIVVDGVFVFVVVAEHYSFERLHMGRYHQHILLNQVNRIKILVIIQSIPNIIQIMYYISLYKIFRYMMYSIL